MNRLTAVKREAFWGLVEKVKVLSKEKHLIDNSKVIVRGKGM